MPTPSARLLTSQLVATAMILASAVTARAQESPARAVRAFPAPSNTSRSPVQGDSTEGRRTWFLNDRGYYEPLIAEPHAARLFLLFPGWSSEFPHSVNTGNRFAWQVSTGREIPIAGWQSASGTERLEKGQIGFGVWIPIAFHMIEDFKDTSNPIVDTDYRFGFMGKLQYGLGSAWWLGVRFVPWAHESTHLGDEYTLLAQRDPAFERVNVSYEYYEYGFSLEHSFGTNGRLFVRHGGLTPWGDDGYYSDHLLGETDGTITPSRKNYEPSFGAEIRLPSAINTNGTTRRQWFASLDARHKLAYAYHQRSAADERRHLSWSFAVGQTDTETGTRVLQAYFVYAYHGVNPYGQLRTQPDHTAVGLGWIFR